MEVRTILVERGIKPTLQRMKILEYLMKEKNHPTVDNLYSDLHPHIPTLSKTTLYNTLKLFIEKGLTTQITIENDEARYDADLTNHGHFKCRKCGIVYDFPHDIEVERGKVPSGFSPERAHLYVWGVCAECRL